MFDEYLLLRWFVYLPLFPQTAVGMLQLHCPGRPHDQYLPYWCLQIRARYEIRRISYFHFGILCSEPLKSARFLVRSSNLCHYNLFRLSNGSRENVIQTYSKFW